MQRSNPCHILTHFSHSRFWMTFLFGAVILLGAGTAGAATPVGQWAFEQASGVTALDTSAQGQNGTVYNGAELDGSGWLSLDGDDDYVSLPIDSLMKSLESCTLAVWIDHANSGGNWQRIFDFGTGTTVNMFLTPRTSSGTLRFAITTGGGSGEQQLTAPSRLPSGRHLVVVRIDASTHTGTLFLDGEVVATNSQMTLTPSDLGATTQNWLGRSQYSSDAYFDGAYDEFRIYDTALSNDQIAILDHEAEASQPVPANQAMGVDADTDLSWVAGGSTASTGGHDLYVGLDADEVAAATRSNHPNVDYMNLDETGFDPGQLSPDVTYYWRVDQVNLPKIWTGPVWSFTVLGAQAYSPSPTNGASEIELTTTLTWMSGLNADRHDLYLGERYDAVAQATTGDTDLYQGRLSQSQWTTALLQRSHTYYWRVDEVDLDTQTVTPGTVWNFKTTAGNPLILANSYFQLTFDYGDAGFTQIKRNGDPYETNFVSQSDGLLGDIEVTYRLGSGDWQEANTHDSDDARQIDFNINPSNAALGFDITYPTASANTTGIKDFEVSQHWVLDGNNLTLDVNLVNTTENTLEIGDLGIPLPFNSNYDDLDTDTIQTKRVLRHGFFSGHASHCYWSRVNGAPDFLVMTTPSPDTRFEYWDNVTDDTAFTAFVYSAISGPADAGTWRQEHTSRVLAGGESIHLRFNFTWADSLSEVRDILYEDGDIDIECVPGMTIPQDLHALVKLRTSQSLNDLEAEYPDDTTIEYVGEPQPDTHLYKITFNHLGENLITIHHNDTEETLLEFFSCDPLETLYKKRASHMTDYEQVVDPGVWYDGLFGAWDMSNATLRTPDDNDGMTASWWIYVICCDDPGNCHAPYLAGKNVHYPVQAQIDALEYYIDNYLWGGMQYTESEYSPYGILGVTTWEYNRIYDPGHIWRVFDYPHIVMLYYHMYEIAKYYPDRVHSLDADGYLNRAYRTALKYFNVGDGWGYTVGTYNEVVFTDLMNSLRDEGWNTQADTLQAEWEEKVEYFIRENPFDSEYAMDSTAFESSHALVKWALENGFSAPDIDQTEIEAFMHEQMQANLSVRGCIEPAFYTYGSDYRVWGQRRYTLSYMSQMGGWAVLDYGMKWTDVDQDPLDYIRLGYGSYLSSWALMNTDSTGENGYWYPSARNDGAIGWAFKPEKNGPIWLQERYQERGIWVYNGEIDLGLCGALRTAQSIVIDDPVFGLCGLGCDVTLADDQYQIVPKDGLREHLVMHNLGLSLKLNRDAFAADQPVCISATQDALSFTLDNEVAQAHSSSLTLRGLTPGTYTLAINDVEQESFTINDEEKDYAITLTLASETGVRISIKLQQ